jgi:hypothetical protein
MVQDDRLYQTSIRTKHVLVNGVLVIRDGELENKVFPGLGRRYV